MKEKYCITIGFKRSLVQFILSIIALTIGCMWGLNIENKKWSQLIYSDIKIANIALGGKTKEEAKNIIKYQYIDAIKNKKLYVTVDDKIYSVDNSNLIKGYDMDNVIDKAFNFGKNLSIIEKHKLIKTGSKKRYSLEFTCDDDSIEGFTRNIEKENNKNPINATIEMAAEGAIKIDADKKGYKIEKEKLNKDIENKIKAGANEDIHITAPVKKTEAVVTKATLFLINTCIASFSTKFESSSFMRANNIDISVRAINGKILNPGESFSFNEVLGERTRERGYMEAPIIINNKIGSGIGGGICQVSSTLYNAILKTGIQGIERIHHSVPSSYVGLGLDATVDWGNIDFKFKNTLEYPIYIEARTQNKNLYINIFSNSDLNKKKYIIDNNINGDANGYRVKVIRKTYENGMLINSEFISNDVYIPMDSGIKKKLETNLVDLTQYGSPPPHINNNFDAMKNP
ncbi:VanW family protein [Clostridium sp. CF012]|uniref:VanW family protein n=1 Tax=Clostridium sp. CF012 TaxID=2843319 RepID=UPI001C0B77F3|nr:VanW family protein [Clostridium sp. CF012]MBU3145524.1 VanW family protein [Clostridium sp. CF012]